MSVGPFGASAAASHAFWLVAWQRGSCGLLSFVLVPSVFGVGVQRVRLLAHVFAYFDRGCYHVTRSQFL